ncbi:MAG: GNAT family N-acetyltransferase [Alphaproteobacteria bacterium]|nr:GNAT family N-acetyltransferase [Alphaproteobacteria bacterium]
MTIRPARAGEAAPLSDLCWRSKAHWGYDPQFMNACREALTVHDEWIGRNWVIVAEMGGDLAGVAAIAPDGSQFEVALFFVDPPYMGKGVGGALFDAMVARARQEDIGTLRILSDPNAVEFYRKMGARSIGTEPSDAIPGRSLPLMEIDLT